MEDDTDPLTYIGADAGRTYCHVTQSAGQLNDLEFEIVDDEQGILIGIIRDEVTHIEYDAIHFTGVEIDADIDLPDIYIG
jgi:hypothetical protein